MDLEEKWQRVMAETRIVRFYRYQLSSQQSTVLPYIFFRPFRDQYWRYRGA